MRSWKIIVNNEVHGFVTTVLWINAVAEAVQFLEDGYLKGRMIVHDIEPIAHDSNHDRMSVNLISPDGDVFFFGLESVAYAG